MLLSAFYHSLCYLSQTFDYRLLYSWASLSTTLNTNLAIFIIFNIQIAKEVIVIQFLCRNWSKIIVYYFLCLINTLPLWLRLNSVINIMTLNSRFIVYLCNRFSAYLSIFSPLVKFRYLEFVDWQLQTYHLNSAMDFWQSPLS